MAITAIRRTRSITPPIAGGPGSIPTPPTPISGGPGSIPTPPPAPAPSPSGMLSAFGVNLTPPNPIKYTVPANPGDIKSVLGSVNTAQNDANVANNQRYQQMLGVLSNGNSTAKTDLTSGYNSALGDLSGSLANNNTVFTNEQNRAITDAMKSSAAATNSGISRGLGNTTVMNSMQDQVTRAKNDALAQVAANKAAADNSVYKDISNIHQNQGNATSGLDTQGSNSIANAIGSRNDVGPQISDYASLIAGAAQAQNSNGKTVIRNTDPLPINSPIRSGGGTGGGGISTSMGNYGGGGGGGSDGINHATVTGGGGGSPAGPYSPPAPSTTGGYGLSDLPGYGQPTPEQTLPQISGTPSEVQPDLSGATPIYDGTGMKVQAWRLPDGSTIPAPGYSPSVA